jgi:phosphatidate cytidylyltransferase
MAGPTSMTSLQQARPFDWSNLRQRSLSALVLATLAILAVMIGSWAFLAVIAAAAAVLANEWSLMSAPRAPLRVAGAITVAVLVSVFVGFRNHYPLAWALLPVGAILSGLIARGVAERPQDAAFGAIYIGAPCLAVTWLRNAPHALQGMQWTFLLLAVTWAADIGAFATGNAIGGPKLWPRISPNKTWAGFIGGLVFAVLASTAVAFWFHIQLSVGAAALMGLVGGLATMAGDLLESVLKRRFGVKDSGDLIPGHGGLLDRVDGMMFAVMAVAAARLIHLAGWST